VTLSGRRSDTLQEARGYLDHAVTSAEADLPTHHQLAGYALTKAADQRHVRRLLVNATNRILGLLLLADLVCCVLLSTCACSAVCL
jgi:hypothetical protein